MGGEGVHVVVLCVCAQAEQREQHEGNNICFHILNFELNYFEFELIVGAKLRPFVQNAKGKRLFCWGNFPSGQKAGHFAYIIIYVFVDIVTSWPTFPQKFPELLGGSEILFYLCSDSLRFVATKAGWPYRK